MGNPCDPFSGKTESLGALILHVLVPKQADFKLLYTA